MIGKSLEAAVKITAPKELATQLSTIIDELKQVFIVSKIVINEGSELKVEAAKFDGIKCFRCWKLFDQEDMQGEICKTCDAAIA